jgi:hypothetical protein
MVKNPPKNANNGWHNPTEKTTDLATHTPLQKRWKTPKWSAKDVNWQRANNTLSERKGTMIRKPNAEDQRLSNTNPTNNHSWLITGFVTTLTRGVPLMKQEHITTPEHLSTTPVFSGVHVTRSLVLCICFVNRCLSFFLLAIVLSGLHRFTHSDYPFGIFKLSLSWHR